MTYTAPVLGLLAGVAGHCGHNPVRPRHGSWHHPAPPRDLAHLERPGNRGVPVAARRRRVVEPDHGRRAGRPYQRRLPALDPPRRGRPQPGRRAQLGHLCPHSCTGFVTLAACSVAGHGRQGDRRGNLGQDDPDAAGVLDPHPGQSPGFRRGRPDDQDSGRGQPDVPGAGIPYLDPDHHRAPGRAHRVPGDPGQSRAGEKHHTRIIRGAELPVDSHAQDVAVETATAVPGRQGAGGSACSDIHARYPGITLSDTGGQEERTHSRR